MKTGRNLFLMGLLMGVICLTASAQVFTDAQTRTDLTYLKRKLDLLHPAMGYYTPQARMEQLYDSLYNGLTGPMDYLTFFRHVSPLVTAIKDGHTNLNHRKSYIGKQTHFLPFYIRPVEDQYFISHNVSADTSLVRGTELLTIDDRTVGDLHRELMRIDHSGSDGDNLTGRGLVWFIQQSYDYLPAGWRYTGSENKCTLSNAQYFSADDPKSVWC
jgi:hypothetical protein